MKPLSAVTAPILAQLYVDRERVNDAAATELARINDQSNRTIDRLTGERPAQPNGKETT